MHQEPSGHSGNANFTAMGKPLDRKWHVNRMFTESGSDRFSHVWLYNLYVLMLPPAGGKFY